MVALKLLSSRESEFKLFVETEYRNWVEPEVVSILIFTLSAVLMLIYCSLTPSSTPLCRPAEEHARVIQFSVRGGRFRPPSRRRPTRA